MYDVILSNKINDLITDVINVNNFIFILKINFVLIKKVDDEKIGKFLMNDKFYYYNYKYNLDDFESNGLQVVFK